MKRGAEPAHDSSSWDSQRCISDGCATPLPSPPSASLARPSHPFFEPLFAVPARWTGKTGKTGWHPRRISRDDRRSDHPSPFPGSTADLCFDQRTSTVSPDTSSATALGSGSSPTLVPRFQTFRLRITRLSGPYPFCVSAAGTPHHLGDSKSFPALPVVEHRGDHRQPAVDTNLRSFVLPPINQFRQT